ncbi:MAG: hypothetical protein JOZ07_16900 [Solirubrobacterales bacterium]|nr:hypothetical protein [Solirubrobacterales bacterium]
MNTTLKRSLVAGGLLLGLLLPSAAAAKNSQPKPLTMDMYSPLHNFFSNPVTSSTALGHHLYVATVRGSVSFYQPVDYIDPQLPFTVMCGKPQTAPLFASAGGVGPVSNDAAFIFAQPLQGKACSTLKLPAQFPNFQANLGKGGWKHPNLVSQAPLRKPSPTHTYSFALDGQGKAVSFRMIDPDTRDDYGSFKIYIRPAVRSDCAGIGHKAFFLSAKACRQDTPNRAAPKLPAAPAPLTLDQSTPLRVLRSSDVPTAINGEFPAGALTAAQFVTLDNATAASATAERTAISAGFLAAAISDFHGLDLPNLKSTAVKFASPAQAQAALTAELTLARTAQAPVGTTGGAAQADPAVPGAYLITFTPGSLELLAAKGDDVLTLRAAADPTPVTRATVEPLFATVLARS